MKKEQQVNENSKDKQLETFRAHDYEHSMTTNQGLKISEDEHSLKAGTRGPTLMEDFHFREKMTHFDHERIPERVVHARGFAAHGEFEVYESMKKYTKAGFLQEPGVKTPVFTRISTVAGSKGSAETVRDVRGFAVKFYTQEGNYDLVGNNMPIFFIQDAIKFPDLVHAVKPEPHNEMPQAASAHDTFWDFVANNQESAAMVMWQMSDRAIPRSLRMMEGFGVHTYRFVNDQGESHFVKFHWKPKLGAHSLVWDEAQKINGKDPDFHRRDLWESIENGNFVEYELGVQLLEEKDEFKFDFDILDPTKLWPEEEIPVKIIGKMTLNRNVDNVFAEMEQVAFHPGSVVPGIDFSNDPLLQGRLFSYTDTQLIRLGGPNFHELPINRPVCPFHNNQRDGYGRQTINVGQTNYHKNSLSDNKPDTTPEKDGGYVHYYEKVDGHKIQARSDSFKDHFSQARLFWNSMSDPEKEHIIAAFSFEVGKVNDMNVRKQVVDMFANVDTDMAEQIADAVGVDAPTGIKQSEETKSSPALSQENMTKLPDTRTVAVLIADQFDDEALEPFLKASLDAGMTVDIVSEKFGKLTGKNGATVDVDNTLLTVHSVLYDALYVVGGQAKHQQKFDMDAADFVNEAYMHFKPIAAAPAASELMSKTKVKSGPGILTDLTVSGEGKQWVDAVAHHRFWDRNIYA